MPISITPWLRMLLGTTLLVQVGYGQDLEQLKNLSLKKTLKQGITLSGSLTGNNVYYRANGRTDRTVPVNLLYTGNLSVDILGKVNMPVTFSFSNQDVNFTHPFDRAYQFRQPFNRLLLKPTYKGFTLHLGTCAMHFSPYTLAGHRFDGVGLDYKSAQRPFYASAMVGNLQRAVRIDTSQQLIGNNLPSYKRIGAGLQLGYRHKEDLVELIVFGAADKRSSLPYSLDERNILPQQNAVVSLKASKQLFRTILLNTELAFSGITNDSRAPANASRTNLVTSFLGTFTPRTSTDYRKAVRVEALYRGKTLTAGLAYSRIDPNYRTLGAYYFANDLETLDGKLATQLLQGKLTLSGNLGVQQDNVLRQNLKTNRRLVGMANVSWVPSQKLNVLLSYSSFTAFSNLLPVYDYLRQVTPYDALDTLNFRQINQNAMLLATLVLPTASSDISRTLTLNTTLQRGDSRQGSSAMSNNLTNLSLDYSQANTTRRISLNGSVNVSRYAFYGSPTTQWGPSLTLMKGVGPNWRTTLTGLYAWSSTTGLAPIDEQSLSARWGLTGQPGKQTTLMLNLIYFNRTASSTERPANAFSEFTATLGMAYRFTLLSLH